MVSKLTAAVFLGMLLRAAAEFENVSSFARAASVEANNDAPRLTEEIQTDGEAFLQWVKPSVGLAEGRQLAEGFDVQMSMYTSKFRSTSFWCSWLVVLSTFGYLLFQIKQSYDRKKATDSEIVQRAIEKENTRNAKSRPPSPRHLATAKMAGSRDGTDDGSVDWKEIGKEIATHPRNLGIFCLAAMVALMTLPIAFMALPILAVRNLGKRLNAGSEFCSSQTLLTHPIWFLGLYIMIPIVLANCSGHLLLIWVAVGITLLLPWVRLAKLDPEWTEIDQFLEHRVLSFTFENVLTVLSTIYVCGQIIGTALLFFKTSAELISASALESGALDAYASFKERLTNAFVVPFLFDIPTMSFSVAFWLAVAFVFAQALMFGRVTLRILTLAHIFPPAYGYGELEHAVKIKAAAYAKLAATPCATTLFGIFCDAMFMPAVTKMLQSMHCTDYVYESSANTTSIHAVSVLHADPGVTCCSAEHIGMMCVAMLCLVYYIPMRLIVAPFMMADSDGVLGGQDTDIQFPAWFVLQERLARLLVVGLGVFCSETYPSIIANAQFVTFTLLWYVVETSQPCSVMWFNVLLSALYGISSTCSLTVLFDYNTGLDWWPVYFLFFSNAVIMAVACCRLARRKSVKVNITPAFGSSFKDTVAFDDTSAFRGVTHRMRTLLVYADKGRVPTGIQAIYEMDGSIIDGPAHCGPEAKNQTPNIIDLTTREVVAMAIDCRGGEGWLKFETSDGETHVFGKNWGNDHEPSGQTGGSVTRGDLKGLRVIGIHGGLGGGLHNLGLVTQPIEDAQVGIPAASGPKAFHL